MGGLHVPEEIIENIVVKLPVRSILRFQSVCNSWFDLITSRQLIFKRLIESEASTDLALCFCFINYSKQRKSYFLDIFLYVDDDDDATVIGKLKVSCDPKKIAANYKPALNFELPRSYNPSSFKLVGNCNGILCLADHNFILLVNPSLKEVKTLPDRIMPYLLHVTESGLVGFGFDNETMDFKVVRISRMLNIAQVYSLKSNAWRELDNIPLLPNNYLNSCSTFLNGVVYWCVQVSFNHWIMLSFNMAIELFKPFECPQGWRPNNRSDYRPGLFVLNQEHLAFISYQYYGNEHSVNVWTMIKHGTEETWTKFYSIRHLPYLVKPTSFWKKHKFLYETTSGKLVMYDLLKQRSSVVCDEAQFSQCINKKLYLEQSYSELSMRVQVEVCGSSLVSIST